MTLSLIPSVRPSVTNEFKEFLAAMSSSRSDIVAYFVCVLVRPLPRCYKGVIRVIQGCSNCVLRFFEEFYRCFKGVLRVFHGCFKEV